MKSSVDLHGGFYRAGRRASIHRVEALPGVAGPV
jgi:hypothetical protein